MRPRRKHLIKLIAEQTKLIKHLENSVIELTAELIRLKRELKRANNE
jgi:hypothetical protein